MNSATPQRANRASSKNESEAFLRTLFAGTPPSLGLEALVGAPSPEALRTLLDSPAAPAPEELTSLHRKLLEGLALLWHGHWDAAHAIAQNHEGDRNFDLLHALVHRREGDFGNSAFWFRAAGKHPCYAGLETPPAGTWPGEDGGLREDLLPGGHWSHAAFIAEIKKRPPPAGDRAGQLRELQKLEFLAFARWILGAT
jgi:hypothetical protein